VGEDEPRLGELEQGDWYFYQCQLDDAEGHYGTARREAGGSDPTVCLETRAVLEASPFPDCAGLAERLERDLERYGSSD
jgi:hypothetical protein